MVKSLNKQPKLLDQVRYAIRTRHYPKGMSSTYYSDLRYLYYEACLNKEDALSREKYLKTGNGKIYLKNRLKYYFGSD